MEIRINIQVERWSISRLIPRITNPRTHTPEQVAQVAASMREFGWTNPILVGVDNDVLAGHARLLAARQLGLTEVPVIQLGHLSEPQRRALVIADNQLAITGAGWDEETLRLELAALSEESFDLSLVGFDDDELARLLAEQDSAEGLTDEDAVPDLPETPTSMTGDRWLLDNHRLLVSDATVGSEVRRLMAGDAADLLFISGMPIDGIAGMMNVTVTCASATGLPSAPVRLAWKTLSSPAFSGFFSERKSSRSE